jgi:hypothetical protein
MSDHDDDDDDDDSNESCSYSYGFGGLLGSIFGVGRPQEMTPAGRMLARLDRADAAIKTQEHIGHDVTAALRRCQIRSQWPTWDHKAGTP